MRTVSTFFVAAAIVAITATANAAVVSSNNFTCTAAPSGQRSLVECTGTFPGVAGLFQATGYDVVHVAYSPDNQRKFYYMSDTGCVLLMAPGGETVATDSSGQKTKFPSFTDAMGACYQKKK